MRERGLDLSHLKFKSDCGDIARRRASKVNSLYKAQEEDPLKNGKHYTYIGSIR